MNGTIHAGDSAAQHAQAYLTIACNDAAGRTSAGKGVYIFQIASALTVNNSSGVVLSGGAQAVDVFWQVGSSATLGTTSAFKETILAITSISIATGGTLDGRALARNGTVTFRYHQSYTTKSAKMTPPARIYNALTVAF